MLNACAPCARPYWWVVVENTAPWVTRVYPAPSVAIDDGRNRYRRAIWRHQQYVEYAKAHGGTWPDAIPQQYDGLPWATRYDLIEAFSPPSGGELTVTKGVDR